MLDFTADIKYSKQQSAKRKKDAVAIIDEIFKEFIRSQDNSAIIFTQKNCGFITYDRQNEFLTDATLACNSLTETLTLPFQISKKNLHDYYMEFSLNYEKDFYCFIVSNKYYCFIKKF